MLHKALKVSKVVWFFATGILVFNVYAQNLALSGYFKNLSSASSAGFSDYANFNYIHNRLNLEYTPAENWSFYFENRNRFFYGENINPGGLLAEGLEQKNYALDVSVVSLESKHSTLYSELDRAYLRGNVGKLEMTLGRQRINWGINIAWNPNDLFNTYNFTDFDYVERPGTDGVRLEYYLSDNSSIQGATNVPQDENDHVAAGLFKSNVSGYDYQILLGRYHQDFVAGGGWAGNILNAGFKGEVAWFEPYDDLFEGAGVFTGVLSLDYFFEKPVYVTSGFLYNSSGGEGVSDAGLETFEFALSPKNLMPTKYNVLLQSNWSVTPLLNLDMASILALEIKGLYLIPSIHYSLAENWGASLLYQGWYHFKEGFALQSHTGYLVVSLNF